MACHTKSTPVPMAATGFWINATDAGSRALCEQLLLQSTANAATDPNLTDKTYAWNQSYRRETVWLWINCSDSLSQFMTMVFHGADGPNNQRYNVCFGISASLGGSDNASFVSGLCASAAKRFLLNNTDAQELYLWYAANEDPHAGDLIFDALQAMINTVVCAPQATTYPQPCMPNTTTTRWPVNQCTYKFM